MTTFAAESAIWYPASVAVSAGFTGVTAAPSRHAAKSATTNSTRLGSMTATTSPLPTPRRRRDAAAASTHARNPALVKLHRIVGDARGIGVAHRPYIGQYRKMHVGSFVTARFSAL